MAMKKPESLLGGNANVTVNVNDYVGVNANVRQEGTEIYIDILSQKIAGDYAKGTNGWASAVQYQKQSSAGMAFSR